MIIKYNTGSSKSNQKVYSYDKESIESYVDETGIEAINLGTCESVYADYVDYCDSYGYLPCSQNMMSAYFRKQCNVVTIVRKVEGRSCRIYVKK